MGGNNSKNTSNNLTESVKTNTNSNVSSNKMKFTDESDYNKIFNLMIKLSNDIFDTHDENFLSEDFCNKIAALQARLVSLVGTPGVSHSNSIPEDKDSSSISSYNDTI